MAKMNINKFGEICKSDGWLKAMEYKDTFVPTSLYKYCSLMDNNYVDYNLKNKMKFDTLREEKLWVSNYKLLNDPFEYKMITLDVERLKESGWDIDFVQNFLDSFKERTLISCFSSEVHNNMPMWAHYASNHTGYCVKYLVKESRNIFPIAYEPVRSRCAVIPTMIISEIFKAYEKGLTEPTEEFYRYFTYLYTSFSCKHNFWNYENEYRLLHFSVDIVSGRAISLQSVGLSVDAIYIGYRCDDRNLNELTKIGAELGCKVYKMNFDEYGDQFKLDSERVK